MANPEQKYRIIDKLDAGGMAEIYRAEAELIAGMKKKVAIKRILPHLTRNQKFVAMFLDEARLSLFLDHANIVHVFDIGRSGQTYFIVMEYVDGANLRALLEHQQQAGRPMATAQALFIVMEVAKGLGYAHDMVSPDDGHHLGIVHRDVSPPNILLSKNGEVKIVDFGLAKAASQIEHTDPGVVKGKFSYLSPEAASGLEVNHLADIFACGIMLWELLAGRRLFYGETDYHTVELIRAAEVPALGPINRDVAPELEEIVRRALARHPGDRFQHAYELQDALAQFLFTYSLKVTSRDIAALVRRCLAVRETKAVPAQPKGTVIDRLIEEEITRFTSLDAEDFVSGGAEPLSPDELESVGPLDPGDFVDPRDWDHEFGPVLAGSRVVMQPLTQPTVQPVPSLENILEGGPTPVAPPQPVEETRSKNRRGMIVTFLVALLLFGVGAATVFALHLLRVFPTGNGGGVP